MTTASGSTRAIAKLPIGLVPLALSFWAARVADVPEAKSRILVIDDEVAMRELLSLYLGNQGLDVGTVQSAVEARVILKRGQFDLVILDWKLDGAEGADLLHLSKTLHTDIPVIIFTGAAPDGLLEFSLPGEADAVVRRGGPLDAMSAAVCRQLEQRRAGQEPRVRAAGSDPQLFHADPDHGLGLPADIRIPGADVVAGQGA